MVAATAATFSRSPPTRGSVAEQRLLDTLSTPLPAHAGVSRLLIPHARPPSAAPRPRGGQSVVASDVKGGLLRSPPTRGSVGERRMFRRFGRPLPAHAGVSR